MLSLIEKAERTHTLDHAEIVQLLSTNEFDAALFQAADRVRAEHVGNEVHLRGLIEFSNICKQNCLYCGLRRDNKNVSRYRLDEEQILDFARKAKEYGYRTIVMQSGEDDYFSVEKLVPILRKIKALDLAITLSIGERTTEEYRILKEAGADRYLLRIETTDKALYEVLDPGMSFDNRVRCLRDLKNLGFELGTGCLVGLPGQSLASLADDILFFKEIDADMLGIGPFIPNPDTPLKDEQGGLFELALKVMAIARLLLPDINLPATTAMETLKPLGRVVALQSGANVVMPNVTEGDYRKYYVLYPGKISTTDTPAEARNVVAGKINDIGRVVSEDYGFRRKSNNK